MSTAALSQTDQNRRRQYRRLVFLTWFLTLDLIMFGAFVRLTDSGLGCPDWPGCYGKVTPIGAMADIRLAEEIMPDGPVTVAKAWIEMLHRYIAVILGMMIIGIMMMAWRWRDIIGRTPWLATVIFVAVCVQGAFGAWTVTLKLMPIIVTIHLLGGMGLLALLTWLAARERPYPPVSIDRHRFKPWVAFGLVLLFIQIALGGWVSTNYAALACMDFPTCGGQWIPPMDFQGGFSLIRGLGELPSGEAISQLALVAIHWVHRNFAWVVFAYLGTLVWLLHRDAGLRGPCQLVVVLLVAQFFTGLTTIFFEWPLLIAVLHNGGAAGLTIAMVTLLVRVTGMQPAQVRAAQVPQFA